MASHELISRARDLGRGSLSAADGKALLREQGIVVPNGVIVIDGTQALDGRLDNLRLPLVAKVMSPDILHKGDSGGVRLHLQDAAAVAAALRGLFGSFRRLGFVHG